MEPLNPYFSASEVLTNTFFYSITLAQTSVLTSETWNSTFAILWQYWCNKRVSQHNARQRTRVCQFLRAFRVCDSNRLSCQQIKHWANIIFENWHQPSSHWFTLQFLQFLGLANNAAWHRYCFRKTLSRTYQQIPACFEDQPKQRMNPCRYAWSLDHTNRLGKQRPQPQHDDRLFCCERPTNMCAHCSLIR